jgi:hypothetical protein
MTPKPTFVEGKTQREELEGREEEKSHEKSGQQIF